MHGPSIHDVAATARRLRLTDGRAAAKAHVEAESATERFARDPAAQLALGGLYTELGFADEAEAAFRAALALKPGSITARNAIATLLLERGQPDAAVAELARLVDEQPRQALFLSNLLLTSQYVPGVTAESLFDLHKLWRARFPAPTPLAATPRDPDPERKLTVAFLSADFAHHAVGYFMRPLFAALTPDRCRLIAIASGARRDAVTPLFAALAHDWHDVGEKPDAEVAALVASLGVDVLVDMAGHTAGNRLGVF
ncbi:MAG: tetratricopeptide repeat protein, partial [Rhodospirillaceae bacterium]|nr:tetratricopeptide repeat protein [Rhodospirillaceae bacterium]